MSDPIWLHIARRDLGLAEIPGADTAPKIRQWLADLGAWWRDDETPWCGVAVGAWMKQAGIARPKHWYRAKGWLEWGVDIGGPTYGCVAVFERAGGGHVGIVVGINKSGHLMVLGGNQGNRVSILPFDRSRAIGYRMPPGHAVPLSADLPILASNGQLSRNEA